MLPMPCSAVAFPSWALWPGDPMPLFGHGKSHGNPMEIPWKSHGNPMEIADFKDMTKKGPMNLRDFLGG